uniref:Uncharacterized protein n=1 Tax=Pararge aegeria TaxID=116150 RepID=S4PV61_9NEOP
MIVWSVGIMCVTLAFVKYWQNISKVYFMSAGSYSNVESVYHYYYHFLQSMLCRYGVRRSLPSTLLSQQHTGKRHCNTPHHFVKSLVFSKHRRINFDLACMALHGLGYCEVYANAIIIVVYIALT